MAITFAKASGVTSESSFFPGFGGNGRYFVPWLPQFAPYYYTPVVGMPAVWIMVWGPANAFQGLWGVNDFIESDEVDFTGTNPGDWVPMDAAHFTGDGGGKWSITCHYTRAVSTVNQTEDGSLYIKPQKSVFPFQGMFVGLLGGTRWKIEEDVSGTTGTETYVGTASKFEDVTVADPSGPALGYSTVYMLGVQASYVGPSGLQPGGWSDGQVDGIYDNGGAVSNINSFSGEAIGGNGDFIAGFGQSPPEEFRFSRVLDPGFDPTFYAGPSFTDLGEATPGVPMESGSRRVNLQELPYMVRSQMLRSKK